VRLRKKDETPELTLQAHRFSNEAFALAKGKETFCAKGRVDAADVATLRRLIYGGGGDGDLGVTRAEADALFDINNACRSAANDPAWATFFAEAVGACLIAVSPFRQPSREAAARDEAWLRGRTSLGEFAKGMARAPDLQGAVREILDPDGDAEDEWSGENDRFETAQMAALEINDEEARWLIGRLSPDKLSEPERRLIEFLRGRSPKVSDLVKPLLNAGSAPAEPPPVFGHRAKPPTAA